MREQEQKKEKINVFVQKGNYNHDRKGANKKITKEAYNPFVFKNYSEESIIYILLYIRLTRGGL